MSRAGDGCAIPIGIKTATIAYTLIESAKLSWIETQAWLTDMLVSIPDCVMAESMTACRGKQRHSAVRSHA